jgi:hypothetical protein
MIEYDATTEPKPKVRLSGTDGNAWSIMGRVSDALRKAGASKEHLTKYQEESMSGDYANLLRVACKYADVS